MRRIKLVFPVIILVACSNSVAKDIKPKFYSDFFTGLETQKVTGYESAKLDYDLTSKDNKNVHFSSCTQVDKVKDGDIVMSEYHLLTMLRLNCQALKKYTLASPSKKSFLQEILIKKDASKLPATSYPYVSEHDRKTRLGEKLKDYQKKFTMKPGRNGAIDVETETDNLLYQVIATGDFNGDKIEDALIRIDWRVIGAFGKGSKMVMVTKISVDKDFEEIK